jgi:hypothetical protein
VLDIITSVVPYLAVSSLMYFALHVSYLLTLALVDNRAEPEHHDRIADRATAEGALASV